ncbi:MAG: SusC/RagA family TonB-linked outer membrane protein [Chitinophagaceae bacterium]|nr:SusC/RagA family TonB-linked outer membrane protein [Chitinophagaceae bacterium]
MKYLFHEQAAYSQLRKTLLIMRLTIILLLACILQAGARGTAQTVTLSVNNLSLEKVCKEIQRQTGYYFVYAGDLNRNSRVISVSMNGVNINSALAQVFAGQPFSYQVIDRVVVVKTVEGKNKINEQDLLFTDNTVKVEGVVLSEQGRPLSETSVTIRSSGKGTFTNSKGEFMLPSVATNDELIISHIGYSTKTIKPKEGIFLEIRMEPAASLLDASVVKGYYVTSNRYNTGNVSTVKGEDIAKSPVTDPILALEGRVPGLTISQSSGVPGAYSKIQLRGQNSIPFGKPVTANDPLYVVDGVPFSSKSLTSEYIGGGIFQAPLSNAGQGQGMSPFNILNPSDIERIEILKDADATAIYGSRGANGVILITTKKGKYGRNKLDINVFTGMEKVTRTMKLLNTRQYIQMRLEAFVNDGRTQLLKPQYTNFFPDVLFWDTTRYTDWQKVLIGNTAHFTNAQVNFSGGDANTQFVISGGYSRRGVILPGQYADQKASVHVAINQTSLDQRLHTQFSANYGNDNSNLPNQELTTYITLPPNAPALFDANGNLNWMPYKGGATWNNPLAYTAAHAKAVSAYLSGNLLLSYNFLKGLDLNCSVGYSEQQMKQQILLPSTYFRPPNNTNPNVRSSDFSTTNSQSWIIEPQANYKTMIAKGVMELSVGSTFQSSSASSAAESGNGYSSDALITNIMAASSKSFAGNNYALYHYSALFGRLGYNWSGKYILNLTGRRDGSSRFGPNKQFGNFGAIGTAWIFSKEKYFQNNFPSVSFGKIRASYGITGNDAIGDYQFLSTYSPSSLSYQNIAGLYPAIIPNPYFQWERVRKIEAGLELGLFKDAILFTASWYRNRTDNQLVGFPLPAITGFNSVEANFPALIQNTGLEFTANTRNIATKKFTWTSYFNLSIQRNKLVSYPGIQKSPYNYIYAVGQSLSSRFLYHYIGINPQTGIYEFTTKTGNGIPSFPEDLKSSQPLIPSYFGGVQNSFQCYGFQLDILIQFVKQYGTDYRSFFAMVGSNQNIAVPIFEGRWKGVGDNTATIQRSSLGQAIPATAFSNFKFSDAVISDASFVRVKNVAISYQLSPQRLQKAHLYNARVYIQCQNLFTITKYKGLDPETQGISLPPLRTITGGVQFTF